jgi:hypothetical protein
MINHLIDPSGALAITGSEGYWLSLMQYHMQYLYMLVRANSESDEALGITNMSWNVDRTIFSYTQDGVDHDRNIPADPGLTVVFIADGVVSHTTVAFSAMPDVNGCPIAARVDFTAVPSPGGIWPVILPTWTRGFVSQSELADLESTLQAAIDALTVTVNQNASDVSALNTALTNVSDSVATITADLIAAAAQIDDNVDRLDAIDGIIASLNGSLASLAASISGFTASITSNSDRITILEGKPHDVVFKAFSGHASEALVTSIGDADATVDVDYSISDFQGPSLDPAEIREIILLVDSQVASHSEGATTFSWSSLSIKYPGAVDYATVFKLEGNRDFYHTTSGLVQQLRVPVNPGQTTFSLRAQMESSVWDDIEHLDVTLVGALVRSV